MPDINTTSGQAAKATDYSGQAVEYPQGRNLSGKIYPDGMSGEQMIGDQAAAVASSPVKTLPQAQQLAAGPQINAPATFSNVPEAPGFFESIQDAYTPGGKGPLDSLGDAFFPSGPSAQDILTANNMPATAENITAATKLAETSGPGFMRTVLPSTAVTGTAAYAGGFFDTPEEPPEEEMQTGADLIALDPSKYRLADETPQYAQGPTTVGTNYGIDPRTGRPYVNPFRRLPVLAAEGGEIFPRRVGGIMPNEGTPGKDSVRAMLMPGEFVMTTDAVRGLGNGNNDQGIRNMYDMMRGLEAKGRATA